MPHRHYSSFHKTSMKLGRSYIHGRFAINTNKTCSHEAICWQPVLHVAYTHPHTCTRVWVWRGGTILLMLSICFKCVQGWNKMFYVLKACVRPGCEKAKFIQASSWNWWWLLTGLVDKVADRHAKQQKISSRSLIKRHICTIQQSYIEECGAMQLIS